MVVVVVVGGMDFARPQLSSATWMAGRLSETFAGCNERPPADDAIAGRGSRAIQDLPTSKTPVPGEMRETCAKRPGQILI